MPNTFRREQRIRSGVDFKSAYNRRCSVADGTLIVYANRTNQPHARLGLSVSRKVGNAVVRNRWKRRIRDAFRHIDGTRFAGIDFVVIPCKGARPLHADIHLSLPSLVRRAAKKLARTEEQK